MTKHDGVQVDSILIDQTKFGEAVRQVRTGNFDLPVALGLQLADRGLKIVRDDDEVVLVRPRQDLDVWRGARKFFEPNGDELKITLKPLRQAYTSK